MKGIVFTNFRDFIEKNFGMETWDEILQEVQPESGGIYTGIENYSDQEMMALVKCACQKKNLPMADAVTLFGKFLFWSLLRGYPEAIKPGMTLKDFLKTIDGVIHVEVRKLYANAQLPTIHYEDPGPNELVMLYYSPRKLCHLALGLIESAAEHFQEKITMTQPLCMHEGAERCRIEISFESAT